MPREAGLTPPVHVVAAVLTDAEDRVLLARRIEGRDLAGAWEFPGGKVEPGESALQALARELDEELGIDVDPAQCTPLIAVPFAYAHKRIVLDVYTVGTFGGHPRGREKQALAWSPVAALGRYPMPDADRPVVAALQQPDQYLITPEPTVDELRDPSQFVARVGDALHRGVGRVQWRARNGDSQALARIGRELAARCDEAGAELLINSATPGARVLAEATGAGLHLTSQHLMALDERPGDAPRVSASCHDAGELARAQQLGLDFAVLGPVQPTTSHPGAQVLGWDGFRRERESSMLPIYALGGLSPAQVPEARRHGAQGVAGISGFLG